MGHEKSIIVTSMIQKRLYCVLKNQKYNSLTNMALSLRILIMGILTIKMPVDSVQDWVSCLHLNSASNTQTVVGDNDPVGKESSTIPGGEGGEDSGKIMSNKPNTNKLNLWPEICVIHLPQEAPVSPRSCWIKCLRKCYCSFH